MTCLVCRYFHPRTTSKSAFAQQEMRFSSGSWRSSNQAPPLHQRYDRDWPTLLTNKPLATLIEK